MNSVKKYIGGGNYSLHPSTPAVVNVPPSTTPDDPHEQQVLSSIKISLELEYRDKISKQLEALVKMNLNKTMDEVDNDKILFQAYGYLNSHYESSASEINKHYPVTIFKKELFESALELGMTATKDALALYFTRNRDPEFMALYLIITYVLGAEIENAESLTCEIVLSIIIVLVQLNAYSKGLVKLINLVKTFIFSKFGPSYTLPFITLFPVNQTHFAKKENQ